MFKENKDYISRKILNYIFFFDIFIVLATAIIMLVLNNYQELTYLKNIIKTIFIIAVLILIVLFIFCIVEIVLNNAINEKIKQFINNKEFKNGIDYIKKLPKIKVLYDIYERQFYYIGLLNLYLDDIEKAKDSFFNININSSIIDTGVFVNTTLYLLLIYEECCETKEKECIKKCFYNNIVAVKKNKYQYQNNKNNIIAIEKILDNDLLNMDAILHEKLEIPLIKRILVK